MYFDCFLEKGTYEKAGFEPMDCEDVISKEKGREKYDAMIQNRKDAMEARRANKDGFENRLVEKHTFNTEEERKRT